MAITLHCESCKKKITAPDDTGGKWGKCPYCNHRCYIPLPESKDEEEIKLAPLDESEEKQYEQMMKETFNITENLLHQTQEPAEAAPSKTNEKELALQIINYLKLMSEGSLDEAHSLAEKIVVYKATARTILASILKAKQPVPQLQDIPKKVLERYIRDMLTRMG
jgi:hypothetical protein